MSEVLKLGGALFIHHTLLVYGMDPPTVISTEQFGRSSLGAQRLNAALHERHNGSARERCVASSGESDNTMKIRRLG